MWQPHTNAPTMQWHPNMAAGMQVPGWQPQYGGWGAQDGAQYSQQQQMQQAQAQQQAQQESLQSQQQMQTRADKMSQHHGVPMVELTWQQMQQLPPPLSRCTRRCQTHSRGWMQVHSHQHQRHRQQGSHSYRSVLEARLCGHRTVIRRRLDSPGDGLAIPTRIQRVSRAQM